MCVKLSSEIKEVDYAEMRTRLYLNLGKLPMTVWNVMYKFSTFDKCHCVSSKFKNYFTLTQS